MNKTSPKRATTSKEVDELEKAYRISRKAQLEREKRQYLERKRKMIPFEQHNYNRIVVFRGTKGFWTIGGHSAIILSELVAPEVKMKVVLRKDTDFDATFSEGVISVRDLDFYKVTLPQCRLIEKEYEERKDALIFFLKDALSAEKYDLISRTEEIKSEELLNMVSSSVVMPGLYRMVRELLNGVYTMTDKINGIAQETIGKDILTDAIRLERAFLLGARTESELEDALNELEEATKATMLDLKIAEDMGVWRAKQCWRVGSLGARILAQLPVERKARKIRQ